MLVVPAHAKVNLALEVTGRRPDGWHDIASVIATIDWHDLVGLRLRPAGRAGAEPEVRVSGPRAAAVPTGEGNLAVRAATLLLEAAEATTTSFDIWLDKEVPAAAGLGGGSADAAAVLRAGARLLRIDDLATLHELAARLGSDVPAVLAGGTHLATGRGEVLHPLPTPALHLAVAVAGASVTAATYAALTDDERRATGRTDRLVDAVQNQKLPTHLLGSALEPAACRAAAGLEDSLARLRATTPGVPWHLTGSGGAAFAIATGRADAERLAAEARAAAFPARACRTVAARP